MSTETEKNLSDRIGGYVKTAYNKGFMDALQSALNYLEKYAAVEGGIPNTALKAKSDIEDLRDYIEKDWEKRNPSDAAAP